MSTLYTYTHSWVRTRIWLKLEIKSVRTRPFLHRVYMSFDSTINTAFSLKPANWIPDGVYVIILTSGASTQLCYDAINYVIFEHRQWNRENWRKSIQAILSFCHPHVALDIHQPISDKNSRPTRLFARVHSARCITYEWPAKENFPDQECKSTLAIIYKLLENLKWDNTFSIKYCIIPMFPLSFHVSFTIYKVVI